MRAVFLFVLIERTIEHLQYSLGNAMMLHSKGSRNQAHSLYFLQAVPTKPVIYVKLFKHLLELDRDHKLFLLPTQGGPDCSHCLQKEHDNVASVNCSVPEASSALLASQFVRNPDICLLKTVTYKYKILIETH